MRRRTDRGSGSSKCSSSFARREGSAAGALPAVASGTDPPAPGRAHLRTMSRAAFAMVLFVVACGGEPDAAAPDPALVSQVRAAGRPLTGAAGELDALVTELG